CDRCNEQPLGNGSGNLASDRVGTTNPRRDRVDPWHITRLGPYPPAPCPPPPPSRLRTRIRTADRYGRMTMTQHQLPRKASKQHKSTEHTAKTRFRYKHE